MSSATFEPTTRSVASDSQPATRPSRLTRQMAAAMVGALVATVLIMVTGRGNADPAAVVAAAGAAALASVLVATIVDRTEPRSGEKVMSSLASVIDSEREAVELTRPIGVAVIELRGIAADTVVDGASAWTEPISVIAKRLADADLPTPARIARLGPHSFGAVFGAASREEAVAVAETLVALCRIPIATPAREIRVDAVAGVCHADAGCRVRGEELLRAADASMRVDTSSAGPVASTGERLRRHARKVIEVETEIRHSLDVDLLTARLAPVVDVHSDEVVGLRSAYDWTAVSGTDPEILRSIAGSLGLRRSIETQYLMRSISAAESATGEVQRRIHARIGADRVTDDRAVGQLGMLIRASGIDPELLVVELDGWGADTLGADAHAALRELGVGVGIVLRHYSTWESFPAHLTDEVDSIAVSAEDLVEGEEVSALRVSRLARVADGELSKVSVVDVDSATVALELSAAGLSTQSGRVHGQPLPASELRNWLSKRLAS